MNDSSEKRYKSTIQNTSTLFLVAYILTLAARNEILPTIFGYLALVPIVINLVMLSRVSPSVLAIDLKK